MEMNKGEAEKCRDIGKRFLREGKWRQAVKFFDKSHRMYPLPGVEAMRERAQQELDKELSGGSGQGAPTSPRGSASSSGVRHRASMSQASTSSDDALRPYTAEQEQMVRKIRACKNHYEVLGVPKNAEENEIKKAYRKVKCACLVMACAARGCLTFVPCCCSSCSWRSSSTRTRTVRRGPKTRSRPSARRSRS